MQKVILLALYAIRYGNPEEAIPYLLAAYKKDLQSTMPLSSRALETFKTLSGNPNDRYDNTSRFHYAQTLLSPALQTELKKHIDLIMNDDATLAEKICIISQESEHDGESYNNQYDESFISTCDSTNVPLLQTEPVHLGKNTRVRSVYTKTRFTAGGRVYKQDSRPCYRILQKKSEAKLMDVQLHHDSTTSGEDALTTHNAIKKYLTENYFNNYCKIHDGSSVKKIDYDNSAGTITITILDKNRNEEIAVIAPCSSIENRDAPISSFMYNNAVTFGRKFRASGDTQDHEFAQMLDYVIQAVGDRAYAHKTKKNRETEIYICKDNS